MIYLASADEYELKYMEENVHHMSGRLRNYSARIMNEPDSNTSNISKKHRRYDGNVVEIGFFGSPEFYEIGNSEVHTAAAAARNSPAVVSKRSRIECGECK